MANPYSGFRLSPKAKLLFYTDFDGNPAEPDDVLNEAMDGSWRVREAEVLGLFEDSQAHPAERLLACCALARWGSAKGYDAVIEAARDPDRVVWRGQSRDRWGGADNSFGILASDVADSDEIAEERGTAELRLKALAALIELADRYQFERHLNQGLFNADIRALASEISDVIRRGTQRLASGAGPSFDLETQVAGLIVALGRAHPERARSLAAEFLHTSPHRRAVDELGALGE
ncbi:hypothetical protein ACW2Q0_29245 [Nocardia sp. R16R-3T]